MKKIIAAMLIAVLMLSSSIPIYSASVGSVTGTIIKTDIKTYIFGELINSYNIGGKTVIICEDLNWFFGFDIVWDGNERTLNITNKSKRYILPGEETSQPYISQNVKNLPYDYYSKPSPSKIYTTDIKTYLDGKEITSYNIGGQTAIVCEDMRNYGYDVVWSEADRSLKITMLQYPVYTPTDIGTVIISGEVSKITPLGNHEGKSVLSLNGKESSVKSISSGDYVTNYFSLSDMCRAMNMKWEWKDDNLSLYTDSAEYDKLDVKSEEYKQESISDTIYKFYIKNIKLDENPAKLMWLRGGTSLTNGQTYRDESIAAYLYNGEVYLPSLFFTDIADGYFISELSVTEIQAETEIEGGH